MFTSPAAAWSEQNIYAKDLANAQHALAREQHRLQTANATIAAAQAALPEARGRAAQLRRVADRRSQAAGAALSAAGAAEQAVRDRRERALVRVRDAQAEDAHAEKRWHRTRAGWVSLTAVLIAVLGALGLLALIARDGRPGWEQSAGKRALQLGAAVAGYLSGLILALSWAGAWGFPWPALLAAGTGTAALIAGTTIGWTQPALLESRHRRGRVAQLAAVAMCLAATAAALAVTRERPQPIRLEAGVLALAHLAQTQAPMPSRVAALNDRADTLQLQTSTAEARAQNAEDELARLAQIRRRARKAQADGLRAVPALTDAVRTLQADYDDYQQLLQPLPPLDESAPTTEDFGSGSGTIGLCADGTLSDSIGRPGACSHHGGVG
jgi:hypothetical protein